MSLSGSIPLPPPFPLPDPFHGPPTLPAAEALLWGSRPAIEPLVASGTVTASIENIFSMDDPRNAADGFPCRFCAVLASIPMTLALCLTLLFAGWSVPVFLLCLPAVPLAGLPPAFASAIPLGRLPGTKSSSASFQQAAACSRPPSPALSSFLLILGMDGGTLRRTHGGMLQEAHVSDMTWLLFEKQLCVGLRYKPQAVVLRDVNHNLSPIRALIYPRKR